MSSSQMRVSTAERNRWSDYAQGARSRSSSVGHGLAESDAGSPALRGTPSFDRAWEAVDERDEMGLTSEDETDDDVLLDDEDEDDEEQEEATSAMMIAEEGRGIIVRGGDGPIIQLHVKPGTTHLLVGSSSTPNHVPSFLANTIPPIATSLLALDISANFLVAIPPALQACVCLEELNIASNPLRALPVFLAGLTSLRVLIADSTGLSTLPPALSALDKLHSLSIRRNKMNSLPSWLCLLPSLETLLVDGNPFQGPWKALVEPLLAKVPMSPLYPPSTPMFPLPSASMESTTDTDNEDSVDSPWIEQDQACITVEDEDTITPARAPPISRSVTAPIPTSQSAPSPPPLSRTRTTPNRAYYERYRSPRKSIVDNGKGAAPPNPPSSREASEREIRRMKSAGELRRSPGGTHVGLHSSSAASSPKQPDMPYFATSATSPKLQPMSSPLHDESALPKRFASLGVSSALSGGVRSRPAMDPTLWDDSSAEQDGNKAADAASNMLSPSIATRPPMGSQLSKQDRESRYTPDSPPRQKEDPKPTRWGFLKKMSMGKMRIDSPPSSRPGTSQGRTQYTRSSSSRSVSVAASDVLRTSATPHIDVRISTTGTLLHPINVPGPQMISRKPSMELLKVSPPPPVIPEVSVSPSDDMSPASPNFLSPLGPTPRSTKRRSFLPIDMAPIPIPPRSPFVQGLTATNGSEDGDDFNRTIPSRIHTESMEQIQRREEEKARETRTRALRSVMAYLRDMHDLGLTQTPNTMSVYGGSLEAPANGARSRRPTVVENGRIPSESSIGSISATLTSRSDLSSHLRSMESRMGLRSSSAQTNSVATVATTDSSGSGSGEERKFKDDKGKRARILREIVETERTYVKGLQELVDIYIKPAAAPVTVLSGVGQSIVPSGERKIVFSGLESLFSFHKESFLPALERVTTPIMVPSSQLAEMDTDGHISLDVARAVAHIFVSHAAFMRMYSTYINNFDNSVQRLKAWVADKPTPGAVLSPSSSTAQLVGLGLTMSAVSSVNAMPDMSTPSVAPLTSGQRKRLKAYLKRCRLNPRHSQLNLEGYLLLPVQRIPRYRLLLEELGRSCPPVYDYVEDPLDRALTEISSLATNMNEGKRESESRRKLVQWQARIRGKFPSPLVQPHRRLIMDGPLHLTRVVRKATLSFEVIDSKGDASTAQVECLSPELTPRSLIGVLCNDLLVLCRDPTEGQEPNAHVDLWAVLRMQTLPQPASIVHGNALRLVDNKAILYFDVPSTSDALTWFRAINLHIPASKA
ncbi:hypothetical protein EW026_g34 [Hermanssonia centrifuga]|uniref:DH domain-containing protein n=1 Tax=Hermanssonia centrifuga TaxID=98765 RepID=A0A4S4KXK5_9APHY|nr:hypothetical protein EW026_g34 [Hermanssonia centrifuga]